MSKAINRSSEQLYLQRAIRCIAPSKSSASAQTRWTSQRFRPASIDFRSHRKQNFICSRCLHTTSSLNISKPPKSHDRGPPSKETTQTDFGALDVLGSAPLPTTAIDACTSDGFALNSNIKVSGSGILLVDGEAFQWRPWIRSGQKDKTFGAGVKENNAMTGKLLNSKGQWEVDGEAWGVLDLVWPKPDLLIIGTGPSIMLISPATRRRINELGIRIEVQDTRNAAAQYNLLATERGVEQVAAALIPMGWKEVR